MAKLGKKIIAQSFKFNCDRYLRFELSNRAESTSIGINDIILGNLRPGLELMINAANKWEADKYQDLIDCSPANSISYVLDSKVDSKIGRKKFKDVTNLFEILSQDKPPLAIIEGTFQVPLGLSPALKIINEKYGIDLSKAKPLIIKYVNIITWSIYNII